MTSPQNIHRVLVTRPVAQAIQWVQHLQQAGWDAVALPLIQIAPATDTQPLLDAWCGLHTRQCVVFVSPNAADCFFRARPTHAVWPEHVRAAAMGPGTLHALQCHGLQPEQLVSPPSDAPQFDSETLWELLAAWAWERASVLIVRGDGGRDWLSERLQRAGATVDHVAAYRRTPPTLTTLQQALWSEALAVPAQHLWFFSSSEAIENLQRLSGATDWGPSQALTTHPRIAHRAQQAGFGHVREARPTVEAVVAFLTSIWRDPGRHFP